MKKTTISFFFCLSLIVSLHSQQTFECVPPQGASSSVTFSEPTCISIADNDFLSFTVTGTNNSSNHFITNVPDGSTTVPANCLNGSSIQLGCNGGNFTVNLASDGCDPTDITLQWNSAFCPDEQVTIGEAPAPIPTMGQWGLIILGFLLSIVSIIYIKEDKVFRSSGPAF